MQYGDGIDGFLMESWSKVDGRWRKLKGSRFDCGILSTPPAPRRTSEGQDHNNNKAIQIWDEGLGLELVEALYWGAL